MKRDVPFTKSPTCNTPTVAQGFEPGPMCKGALCLLPYHVHMPKPKVSRANRSAPWLVVRNHGLNKPPERYLLCQYAVTNTHLIKRESSIVRLMCKPIPRHWLQGCIACQVLAIHSVPMAMLVNDGHCRLPCWQIRVA
jgi:hypothetical protein